MKRSRYSDEQIAYALRQAETGTAVAEVLGAVNDCHWLAPFQMLEPDVWDWSSASPLWVSTLKEPFTSRRALGAVVPIPTFPPPMIRITSAASAKRSNCHWPKPKSAGG